MIHHPQQQMIFAQQPSQIGLMGNQQPIQQQWANYLPNVTPQDPHQDLFMGQQKVNGLSSCAAQINPAQYYNQYGGAPIGMQTNINMNGSSLVSTHSESQQAQSIVKQRYILHSELGQGSFSKLLKKLIKFLGVIYQAFDIYAQRDVALKMEKKDKARKILQNEYSFLKRLQSKQILGQITNLDIPHIVKTYDFENQEDIQLENFIVMDLKGISLASYKKNNNIKNEYQAIDILQQVLTAIQFIHHEGIIHRDIKPSNFVMGFKPEEKNKVFLVDFGLAKEHLDPQSGKPYDQRRNTDFRGTIPYASINAHLKKELSRRDDLWCFFYMMLEFLDEQLVWKTCSNKDKVKEMKIEAFKRPDLHLYPKIGQKHPQIKEIHQHLVSLKYADEPNYDLIREKLIQIQKKAYKSLHAKQRQNLPAPQQTLGLQPNAIPQIIPPSSQFNNNIQQTQQNLILNIQNGQNQQQIRMYDPNFNPQNNYVIPFGHPINQQMNQPHPMPPHDQYQQYFMMDPFFTQNAMMPRQLYHIPDNQQFINMDPFLYQASNQQIPYMQPHQAPYKQAIYEPVTQQQGYCVSNEQQELGNRRILKQISKLAELEKIQKNKAFLEQQQQLQMLPNNQQQIFIDDQDDDLTQKNLLNISNDHQIITTNTTLNKQIEKISSQGKISSGKKSFQQNQQHIEKTDDTEKEENHGLQPIQENAQELILNSGGDSLDDRDNQNQHTSMICNQSKSGEAGNNLYQIKDLILIPDYERYKNADHSQMTSQKQLLLKGDNFPSRKRGRPKGSKNKPKSGRRQRLEKDLQQSKGEAY
ncbi:serine threonine protein kinase [Stylonychia lemnae]|uniref:Casein kinase I n=1 Tax=Stylonychia lemnae TaxID=5949 RepID=A0A078B2Y0_STYLE|nr:serine threonine protein kinase [Stylonychia lemnae]|eukprot:CDW88824.1 serine threonine protein kinase [Stylonychia lemnae]